MRVRDAVPGVIGAAVVVLMAACTTVNVAGPSADPTSVVDSRATDGTGQMGMMGTSVNRSDVMFVQMMIPHHEQAVDIAQLAPSHDASAAVLGLASRIAAEQGPEIRQMSAMLDAWGVPQMMGAGTTHGMGMNGLVSDADMDALRAASGAAFDRMFLQLMIEHHEGAIAMTRDPLANGEDPELRLLLESIVATQGREIDEMRSLLVASG